MTKRVLSALSALLLLPWLRGRRHRHRLPHPFRRRGQGGHLLDARINGACELFVTAFPGTFAGRRTDPELGINLYEF